MHGYVLVILASAQRDSGFGSFSSYYSCQEPLGRISQALSLGQPDYDDRTEDQYPG